MTIELRRHTWTVEDYHRMIEAGVLSKDDKVELLEGEIVEMSPIGDRHAGVVDRLLRVFDRAVGDYAIVRSQGPVPLPPNSEPQPDITLLAFRSDFYTHGAPQIDDVLLAVEVADSSVLRDRQVKLPLYARAGLQETWLVDLPAGQLEVHRQPRGGGYEEVAVRGPGDTVSPEALPGVTVEVAGLLS